VNEPVKCGSKPSTAKLGVGAPVYIQRFWYVDISWNVFCDWSCEMKTNIESYWNEANKHMAPSDITFQICYNL